MIFLRHPVPDVRPGICYGQLDLDITNEGHAQIARALEVTPKAAAIIASPARRCRKLALALGERDGVEPVFDARLWEMHMGEWEGLAWADIPRQHAETWLTDPVNLPTPGGECFADLQARVMEAIAGAGHRTAIVCHAGPIRAVQMAWQGLTFRQAFSSTPPYCEPIELFPPDALKTPEKSAV
jgi:alpha-ribazole phosphatase